MTNFIARITNGPWKQNCYLVKSRISSEAVIIDPGSDPNLIEIAITEHAVQPVAIINTHAHFDHIGAVAYFMTNYCIPFYLHGDDSKLLRQANIYKFFFESKDMITIPAAHHDLREVGTKLVVSGIEIGIIHTPGHTKGSVCLEIGSALFSGDTLLPSGPGRTDLPGADKGLMRESIDVLRQLDGSTIIYPGHGKHFELNTVWRKIEERGPLA